MGQVCLSWAPGFASVVRMVLAGWNREGICWWGCSWRKGAVTEAAVVGARGDDCGHKCLSPERGLLCSPASSIRGTAEDWAPPQRLPARSLPQRPPVVWGWARALALCPWTPLFGFYARRLPNGSKTSAPCLIFCYCQRWGKVLNFECSQSCWGYCGFCLCLVQGCGAAGSRPALALAAISLLSQSLDRGSTLSIWDAMRPSFLVYSSWQAKPCVMHGRGWERFLGSGTEAEPASPAVPAGRAAGLSLRRRASGAAGFPPEDCRASHLTFLSLAWQSRQHACYHSSAWWAPARFMSGCACGSALGVMKSLLSFAGYLFEKSGIVMLKRAALW